MMLSSVILPKDMAEIFRQKVIWRCCMFAALQVIQDSLLLMAYLQSF